MIRSWPQWRFVLRVGSPGSFIGRKLPFHCGLGEGPSDRTCPGVRQRGSKCFWENGKESLRCPGSGAACGLRVGQACSGWTKGTLSCLFTWTVTYKVWKEVGQTQCEVDGSVGACGGWRSTTSEGTGRWGLNSSVESRWCQKKRKWHSKADSIGI